MANKKILFLTLISGACLLFSFVVASKVQAAVGSQCATGTCGTAQTGCGTTNDTSILSSQCQTYFAGYCTSMTLYLMAMMDDCHSKQKSSLVAGDCDNIMSGGYYGACASIYASYVESSEDEDIPPDDDETPEAKLSGTGIEIPTGTGLPDPPGGIVQIVRNLLTWLLGIVGVIAIIGFVISGIQYLTSAGSEDQMQSAKRNMLYAIIGVVVVLSSYVVIQAIQYALEARSMF